MAKAAKKPHVSKEVDVDAVDGTEAIVVADAVTVYTAPIAPVAEHVGENTTKPAAEVKQHLVFGMKPNPPLAAMNKSAEATRRDRSEVNYHAAQRALARAFKRRVVG